jgi:hypothetical protein
VCGTEQSASPPANVGAGVPAGAGARAPARHTPARRVRFANRPRSGTGAALLHRRAVMLAVLTRILWQPARETPRAREGQAASQGPARAEDERARGRGLGRGDAVLAQPAPHIRSCAAPPPARARARTGVHGRADAGPRSLYRLRSLRPPEHSVSAPVTAASSGKGSAEHRWCASQPLTGSRVRRAQGGVPADAQGGPGLRCTCRILPAALLPPCVVSSCLFPPLPRPPSSSRRLLLLLLLLLLPPPPPPPIRAVCVRSGFRV